MKGDEGLVGARAHRVNRTRQLALAGTALARNEHRGSGAGDLTRGSIDLLHHRARADEALEALGVALADLPTQVLRFRLDVATLQRPFDDEPECIDVDWLGEEVL